MAKFTFSPADKQQSIDLPESILSKLADALGELEDYMICTKCRPAKRHKDCAYCGYGGPCTHICGVCKLAGIDGPVIRGTERRRCKVHRDRVLWQGKHEI